MSKAKKYTKEDTAHLVASEPLVAYSKIDGTQDIFENKLHVIHRINKGISFDDYVSIRNKSPYGDLHWAKFLNVSTKTLERYALSNNSFKPLQSEKILELAAFFNHALVFFNKKENLIVWLESPNYGLEFHKPVDLLSTSTGIELVTDIIVRAEHGIFI